MVALWALAGLFFACLPDLSALNGALADAGGETTTVSPVSPCGDGFIDEDAGEECDPVDASTACVACKIACPGVTDDASSHCYYVVDGGATSYTGAATSCAGGHLVTIGSEREAMLVDALDAGAYWVGASYQPSLGGFGAEVPTEPGLNDGGCAGCFARALIETDAASGECLIASDGGWLLSPCFDGGATTAICEREPVGVRSFYCSGPYCATVKGVGKRYLLYLASEARTAAAAAEECARYDEGRLVVFESREERERVVRELLLLGIETPFEAWIGLTGDGGTFNWDDGRPVDDGGRPSPWGDKQPGAASGRAYIRVGPFLDSQLAQANGDDATSRPFICQRAP